MFNAVVDRAVTTFNTIWQAGRDWPQDQYDNFHRLYIIEDLPLREVIRILKQDHGFVVTPKQCKSKIKEQGLKKYLKGSEMDTIIDAHETQKKRKLGEDPNATIHFGGLKILPERIERYKKRRGKRESEIIQSPTVPLAEVHATFSQEIPSRPEPHNETTIESIPTTPKVAPNKPTNPTIYQDLGSLLDRLCISRPSIDVSRAPEESRSDSTIDIQQMILINKPQQHELELLRGEWEKQRETAWHFLSKGRLRDAECHARVTLAAQESCIGVRHFSTMGSINILSYIHGSQTNSSEVTTYKWMHEASLEIYGPSHECTVDSMRDLAWAYQAAQMEEEARNLLRKILTDLVQAPEETVKDIGEHFNQMSRATTDIAVLLCLQESMVEYENLLGILWSAVAFFTLKHKCSLRVASAMGRKLAGMGEHDDAAFLLTVIVQNAVTDTSYRWRSYTDVSSRRIVAGRATVGELLEAYEKHVLPLQAKTMAILRKYMGFGKALCEPILEGGVFRSFKSSPQRNFLQENDLRSFCAGKNLKS